MVNIMTVGEKAKKSKKIAEAALSLFETKSFNDISMAEIAKKAGVAKGTLFNYYETKESIFMDLLLTGYQEYFSTLNQKIADKGSLTIAELKQLLLEETKILVQQHTILVRLNALREPVLEGHANMNQTLIGRKKLNKITSQLGQTIANKIENIIPQEASRLFIIQSAIISGLLNMANLDEFNHQSLNQEFEAFQFNLEEEAIKAFEFYLNGFLLQKDKIE
ncbi:MULTISPECIES: TetR/AcrR family transcriptional regulator [Bacillus]|nr:MULTISPECIES: TetR/AcrR family transcriptional regulator [Bacillus]MCU5003610.1 TetR/AcrR family transcriptional regulator [Bacillus tropicus]MDR4160712.1 TetR/AcrR family transcriptional regulator [Bacillus paranthracis]MED1516341.1 TetR/AcrR family transcriptional regulator [Bacillus paranthracis]OJD55546.1 TetR family transcriptional regulator [Bacillus sp. N35-10-4]TNP14174.1 TetR/AcrR family transcriptional regulator [Bacillus tropicus]